MASVQINDENFFKKYGKPITYYMDDKLKKNLDENVLPYLKPKEDEDRIILIDGREGAGKSTLGFQIAKYIDPSFNLSRICFGANEFRDAIFKATKGQVVIYDEAFTGLSSRTSLSGVNKLLVSLMMQMRQKNLCVILILPTVFLLDKYAVIHRATSLIHVYKPKGIKGYFKVYNRKLIKLLLLFGSKTWNYSPKVGKRKLYTKFKGRFYGVFALGDEIVEKEYRNLKLKAFENTEKDSKTPLQDKFKVQRDVCIYLLKKKLKLSYRKIEEVLNNYKFEISYVQIRAICSKYEEKEAKDGEKQPKEDENMGLEAENEEKEPFDEESEENEEI